MKCPHCLVEYHPNIQLIEIGTDADGGWVLSKDQCPACNRLILRLVNARYSKPDRPPFFRVGVVGEPTSVVLVRPLATNRPPCPREVPASIAEDYTEACRVLPLSPKASAAMSRRCLQSLLREAAGVKPGNLSDEIGQVIDGGKLPSHVAEGIDAIRKVGNFAAHPSKSNNTREIVPVEPQEAEWNLEVLEELFDHYYVKPTRLAEKRDALNKKLAEAGRPPLK